MPDLPRRLVVIEAAIPTGETCDGCDFVLILGRWVSEIEKVEDYYCPAHKTNDLPTPTNGLRLPACRARDAYQVVEAERLEELRGRLLDLEHYAAQYKAAMKTTRADWHKQAENDLAEAHKEAIKSARRVAEERKT